MQEIVKLNSQKAMNNDLDNFMIALMMLGVACVATFMCYLILKNCKEACMDLYNARPLIFRKRQNAVSNVSAPSSVAHYPTPQHTQFDPGSNVAAVLTPH